MTDPIADMLTRIRNAFMVKKQEVFIPFSKIKFEIAEILKKENFIKDFEEIKENSRHQIKLILKYDESGTSAIESLKRISKPGRRIYAKNDRLPRVLSGLGIAIVSTSYGLMTNKEARYRKLGGEILCEVY